MEYVQSLNMAIGALNSVFWIVLGIAIVRFCIMDYKLVQEVGNNLSKNKKDKWLGLLAPLWPKVKYLVLGALLVCFSYVVTTILYRFFPDATQYGLTSGSFLSESNQAVGFILAVLLFTFSGYSLMLSLGTKWLLGLSKLFATMAVIITVIIAIAPYF